LTSFTHIHDVQTHITFQFWKIDMIKKMYGHSFSCNVSEWGQRPLLKKTKQKTKTSKKHN